jgi:hypothetical protein
MGLASHMEEVKAAERGGRSDIYHAILDALTAELQSDDIGLTEIQIEQVLDIVRRLKP